MRDTVVPGASHPTVTSDACPGRIPVAENRVVFRRIAVSPDDTTITTATCTTSCRTITVEFSSAVFWRLLQWRVMYFVNTISASVKAMIPFILSKTYNQVIFVALLTCTGFQH